MWDTAKTVLKVGFMATKIHIKKNNLKETTPWLKKQEKEK